VKSEERKSNEIRFFRLMAVAIVFIEAANVLHNFISHSSTHSCASLAPAACLCLLLAPTASPFASTCRLLCLYSMRSDKQTFLACLVCLQTANRAITSARTRTRNQDESGQQSIEHKVLPTFVKAKKISIQALATIYVQYTLPTPSFRPFPIESPCWLLWGSSCGRCQD